MNTYALSNCPTLSPEPFVSYGGRSRKVTNDITFVRRQMSVQKKKKKSILLDFAVVLCSFPPTNIVGACRLMNPVGTLLYTSTGHSY